MVSWSQDLDRVTFKSIEFEKHECMHEGRITSTTFRSEKYDLGFMLSNCFHVLYSSCWRDCEPIWNDWLRGEGLPCSWSQKSLLWGSKFVRPCHVCDLCLAMFWGQLALLTRQGARGTRLPPLSLLVYGAAPNAVILGFRKFSNHWTGSKAVR